MRAAYAVGGAGIGSLELREEAPGKAGPGEAQVRLTAATFNYRDLLFIRGDMHGMTREPDYIPMSCAAGVVEAVGEGVTRVKPGDRVSPIMCLGWTDGGLPDPDRMLGGSVHGVARQCGVFDAEDLVLLPDEMGDLEASTLPCAGVTAWTAIFGGRSIGPGDWLLAQGTGGVSLAALQWAKAAGANVAITSSSDAKLARAEAFGADLTINYCDNPDWGAEARRRIGGGVDIVIDVVGSGERDEALSVLNDGGKLAAIGRLDGEFNWTNDFDPRGREVVPVAMGNREAHEAMLAFAAQHRIRPVVDMVYDLDRIEEAMRHFESGQFFGKVGLNLL